MKKRILSLFLVLIMVLSIYVPAMADNGAEYPVPLYSVEDFFFWPESLGFYVSEDGQSLLYLAQSDGIFNIFRRDIASGEETQLTFEKDQHILNYFLKGETLLYSQDTHGDEVTHIYRVNDDGSTTNLTPYPGVLTILISVLEDTYADDEILVAMNRVDPQRLNVYRLNIHSGELTSVLDEYMDGIVVDNDGAVRMISVLNGVQIMLYHRYTDDDEFELVGEWHMDESITPLVFDENNQYVYAVSNIGRDTTAVILMDPATGEELEVISSREDVDVHGLSLWEPGVLGMVLYHTDRLQYEFHNDELESWYNDIISLFDGDYIFSIPSTSKDKNISIVSTLSDVSRGGTYLVDRTARKVEQLTNDNGNIDPAHMAPMLSVEYTARDGLTVPGYLTLPVGVEPVDLPLVVIPHGGPWFRDYWGFDSEAQFLANRGYAVLQPNFRTSSGYGRDFLQAGYGEWGLAMQDDLTDGVLWLIEEGIADPDRVGIYGASYGGYATLAGVAYTPDLYAAAISYVGISNLFTFLESIPAWWESQRELLYYRVGHPERDFEQFMSTSPVFSAANITTPLFIAHGANDPRCTLDEALQIVDAMTERDVDVEFFVAWDEGHGFVNDENTEIFYRVMEVFFSEHLGGRTLTTRADLPDPLFDTSPLETWGKSRFTDVNEGDWFYEAIEYAYQMGLMQGTGADRFSPNAATTRGMIATILHRMMGSPALGNGELTIDNGQFTDVVEGTWYYDAVMWAAENGIVSGVGDGRFAPSAPASRQDLALLLSNFAAFAELALPELQDYPEFDDDAGIADYAKEAVEELSKAMIISGKPGNRFDPQGNATRAELATMLVRFLSVVSAQ